MDQPSIPQNTTPPSLQQPPQPPMHQEPVIQTMPASEDRGVPSGGLRLSKVLALVIIFIVLGGAAYAAYYFKVWPFQQGGAVSKQQALANAFVKMKDIHSLSYNLNLSAITGPREPGVQSFQATMAVEAEESETRRLRDENRLRDLYEVLPALKLYHAQPNGEYPEALGTMNPRFVTTGFRYTPAADRKDFELVVRFETDDALDAIRSSDSRLTVSGIEIVDANREVTFRGDAIEHRYIGVYRMPQGAGVSFLKSFGDMQESLFERMPTDMTLTISLGGSGSTKTDTTANAQFHIGGEYKGGDLTIAAEVEFIKVGETVYIRVTKMPSFFFDISSVKGQWVKITSGDMLGSTPMSIAGFDVWEGEAQEKSQKAAKQFQDLARIAFEEQLLTIDYNIPNLVITGSDHFVYDISLNRDRIASFYKRATDEFKATYGEEAVITFSDEVFEFLSSESFKKFIDYLNANLDVRIAVDVESGYADHYFYTFKIAPPEASPRSNKQLTLTAEVSMTDINKPLVITAPASALSFDDAWSQISGVPTSIIRYTRQLENVNTIRRALHDYRAVANQYPANLDELTKTRRTLISAIQGKQLTPQEEAAMADTSQLDMPFIRAIPKDIFTSNPFVYSAVGSSYMVRYSIQKPTRSELGYTSSMPWSYTQVSVYDLMKAVEGMNTATEMYLSVEANQELGNDTDADGLFDMLEDYYGSNNQSDDSDNDGYKDADEVKNGYDPAGPGRLDSHDIYSFQAYLLENDDTIRW